MVLSQLGSSIVNALRKMTTSTVLDEEVINTLLKEIEASLLSEDVNPKLIAGMVTNIKSRINATDIPEGVDKRRLIKDSVFEELINLVDPKTEPFKPKKGKTSVLMMVGLQGAGKTTTITKLALYYKNRGYKPSVVCADTFRAGAYEQLQMNAKRAGVPFFGIKDESDPVKAASAGVKVFRKEKNDIILVDTSGRHKQDTELFKEMQSVKSAINPDNVIFVMDGAIGQAAFAQAKAFHDAVDVGSVVITKLDGHSNGGGALSAVAATKSPIVFIGTGEKVNEIEEFDAESFVRRLLGMGDLKGINKLAKDFAENPEYKTMIKHLQEGSLTVRDWKEQLTNLQKMGQLGNIMQMIGLNHPMFQGGNIEKKFKGFTVILDSMTDKELDGSAKAMLADESRMKRLAKGSGRDIREVGELFEQIKMFQAMIDRLPKAMRAQLSNTKNPTNDADMMNYIQKMMPKNANQQQIQQMVKQMQQSMGMGMGGQMKKGKK
ncbi:signal recognition particle 54 kDa protein, putative [Entamoeba invadens IP1]|uniref:Signal recognition particle 54 kDa protein n=1 Tax=Entamoeba invadens IP1 TaxID=370355 RepID=L7FMR0_ENTIV|nr:signal recognition particle 54 kDa protein, putative [Entamoeba invadens IP1]ELP92223.1 signal recognition particle 54 kDa protein, putative [Entamoeba invadens IP1]|eukprot:XP_004258994.1 signal recognition particle 54 kDa protein, putative [Entamoeba invadens IP1]